MFRIISLEEEKLVQPYVCGIYQFFTFFSFTTSLIALISSTIFFNKSTEHATSKILMIYNIFISFLRSIFALYLTISVLFFGFDPNGSKIIILRRIIIVSIIKQRFIPFLMMADWNFRITKISSKGKNSFIFFGISFIFETFISVVIAAISFIPKINVPLYFNICIFITVTFAAFISKVLFEKAKKLRKKSVLTSSLIERHTFSKMVVFFKRFFPIILIDTGCGIICVAVSLSCLYIINVSAFLSFCLSFMWLEVSAIINSFYATKDILYFNLRPFWVRLNARRKRSSKVSHQEIAIETMTGKIPGAQTIDEHFVAFNSWIK